MTAANDLDSLAARLKAIADPVRLRVACAVRSSESGEICACELPALLDKTQPTVSHHLALMVRSGILSREQRGKWAWFRLTPTGDSLLAALGIEHNGETRPCCQSSESSVSPE